MTLRVCTECRRHFAAEAACPFCGAAAPPASSRAFSPARLSRAAAFAGVATVAGCYTRESTPYYAPPPPPPAQQQQPPPPPESPVVQQQNFADPPAVAGDSRIEGTVTDSQTNAAMASVQVSVQSIDRPAKIPSRATKTDATGHFSFVDLPAGRYRVLAGPGHPRFTVLRDVALEIHDVKTVDVQIYTPPPSNVPMPYGAPPSRRRVV